MSEINVSTTTATATPTIFVLQELKCLIYNFRLDESNYGIFKTNSSRLTSADRHHVESTHDLLML
jgi:hypothetical protein